MHWLRTLIVAGVCGCAFSAHAQEKSTSELGAEAAAFTVAARVWTYEGWQEYLALHPDGPRATLARQALTSLAPGAHDSEAARTQARLDAARGALDRFTIADWNCADLPTLATRMFPAVGVEEMRLLAERGDARAQTLVGWATAEGLAGFDRDYYEGVRLLQLAADQRFAPAQANMGDRVVGENPEEGVRLLREAAAAGNGCGQVGLALAYQRGTAGLEVNHVEAARLNRLAAEQGNSFGQNNLAQMYLRAQGGLPNDPQEAARLLRLSAAQGNRSAQYTLGRMHYGGPNGVAEDYEEAARLFTLAAAQGYAPAQSELGFAYVTGRGVPRDDAEARRQFEAAAAQGDAQGQYNLAIMFEEGMAGLEPNRGEQVFLLQQAAAQGHETARQKLGEMGEAW